MGRVHMTDNGPKPCKAKTPESCRANFNGEKSEHFDNIDEAQEKFNKYKENQNSDVMPKKKKVVKKCDPSPAPCSNRPAPQRYATPEEAEKEYKRATQLAELEELHEKYEQYYKEGKFDGLSEIAAMTMNKRIDDDVAEELENYPAVPTKDGALDTYNRVSESLNQHLDDIRNRDMSPADTDALLEKFHARTMLKSMSELSHMFPNSEAGNKEYWTSIRDIAQIDLQNHKYGSPEYRFDSQLFAKAERHIHGMEGHKQLDDLHTRHHAALKNNDQEAIKQVEQEIHEARINGAEENLKGIPKTPRFGEAGKIFNKQRMNLQWYHSTYNPDENNPEYRNMASAIMPLRQLARAESKLNPENPEDAKTYWRIAEVVGRETMEEAEPGSDEWKFGAQIKYKAERVYRDNGWEF